MWKVECYQVNLHLNSELSICSEIEITMQWIISQSDPHKNCHHKGVADSCQIWTAASQ